MSEWLLTDEEIKEIYDRWQAEDFGESPPIIIARAQAEKVVGWLDSHGYFTHSLREYCDCNLCALRREFGWKEGR